MKRGKVWGRTSIPWSSTRVSSIRTLPGSVSLFRQSLLRSQAGGWRPRAVSSWRMARISGRFSDNASAVALPTAVKATSLSSCQRKCSAQTCVRGLNSGTSSPESGSVAICFAHLRSEHDTHAKARLSAVIGPPATRGRHDPYGTSLPGRVEIACSTRTDRRLAGPPRRAGAAGCRSWAHPFCAQP